MEGKPEIEVPLVTIHFRLGFSIKNHSAAMGYHHLWNPLYVLTHKISDVFNSSEWQSFTRLGDGNSGSKRCIWRLDDGMPLDEWWMKIRLMLLWLLRRESSHIISKLQTNISLKILGSCVRRESKLHWRVGLAIYPTEVGIYGWQRSYSLLTLGSERLWSHARWYPVAIICFITPLKCRYIIIPAGNWFGSLAGNWFDLPWFPTCPIFWPVFWIPTNQLCSWI